MQCYEYEVMRRWMCARLRIHGAEVQHQDSAVSDALLEADVDSITDVMRLQEPEIEILARRFCVLPGVAA